MIFGDPFIFALQFQLVKEWNSPDDLWRNGLFFVYIDGKQIFSLIEVVELRTTINSLSSLTASQVHEAETELDRFQLYQKAHDFFYGEGVAASTEVIDLTPTAMSDNGCYLFYSKTTSSDRLVWSEDDGITIGDINLPSGVVAEVLGSLQFAEL